VTEEDDETGSEYSHYEEGEDGEIHRIMIKKSKKERVASARFEESDNGGKSGTLGNEIKGNMDNLDGSFVSEAPTIERKLKYNIAKMN